MTAFVGYSRLSESQPSDQMTVHMADRRCTVLTGMSGLNSSDGAEVAQVSAGSLWRRWDPHVHLPGTLFNDQFGEMSVAEALDALAACDPPIEAVGVTDYFSTRSFRAAADAQRQGAGAGIQFLFPNVELRLNIPTRKGSGVNAHLLCVPEQVDWLDQFLGRLSFSWSDREFRADDAGLIALGRAFRGDPSLPEEAARRAGAEQFKVSPDQLREQFLKDRSSAENCLVGFAAAEGDGTSGVRTNDGAFRAQREQLERFAGLMFSSNDKNRRFWLGQGDLDADQIVDTYGSLKPCLHGSDAHSPESLGKPDGDRFTWLKGDPTFDTLRLACLAPATRAMISAVSPAAGQDQGRIIQVAVEDRPWFPQHSLPINPGLVAIIGARGSGKTALADLIAAGAGSTEAFDNEDSFISRAGKLIDGDAVITWYGGDTTAQHLRDPDLSTLRDRRVRYLSQQFVERLCASDGVSDALLEEIQRVVYNAWPIEDRQGAIDFAELLEVRLGAVRTKQQMEAEAVRDLSEDIINQWVLKHSLERKREGHRALKTTAQNIADQIEALTARSDTRNAQRHHVVSEALAARQQQLQSSDRRLTDLKALEAAQDAAERVQFPRYVERLRQQHPQAGLSAEQWLAFQPQFSGDVGSVLAAARAEAEQAHDGISGSHVSIQDDLVLDDVASDDLRLRTVAELKHEQVRLQKLVGLDADRAARLTRLQRQASETRAQLSRLETEIAEAEGADARSAELIRQRAQRYESYFNAIIAEEKELQALYAPLREIIERFGPSVAKLQLSVGREIDVEAWARQGEELIDSRTAGAFNGLGAIARVAEEELLAAWRSADGKDAAEAIQSFSEKHSSDLRKQGKVPRGDDQGYRDWERSVASWLYSVDHIHLTYRLEYQGLDVQQLSPGTRGIVLLLLYLAVDQSETDPLIIDQPEENLDPESVHSELVHLFRDASSRRQIIMVTHNANLVVNTDVDQVLIARAGPFQEGRLPELTYVAGGLERTDVRRAVCDVLEGGAEAFRQRARRLRIDLPGVSERVVS